ncbi:MAG TPA: NAD(P)-binding protein [Symbiobacteriaceae bacterium]|nr:NAD(P)-binding protein [Symbiobacteriaceae bacterium]
MRIAIVGAGLAGLACAHELERLGFAPELFEKRPSVGDRMQTPETMAQFLHHNPGQDLFRYIRDELMLPLHPAHAMIRMVIHSPNHEGEISGRLGYVTIRGRDERSMEYQLLRHISTPIHYNTSPDVNDLRREYDHVVVATGNQSWTRQLTRWEDDLGWWARGALVKGDFTPGELHFFFNTRYAKTGYCLLSALDERTATAGVAIPEASAEELEAHWQVFRLEQGHWWQSEVEQFQFEQYECGRCGSVAVGNVLLVGAAAGFVESLGMNGVCASLTSGVMAARQIALQDRSLERFARRWRIYSGRLARLRRNVNAWTDEEMDRMAQAVKMGAGLLTHSPWNLVVPGGLLLDMLRLADDPSPEVGWQ